MWDKARELEESTETAGVVSLNFVQARSKFSEADYRQIVKGIKSKLFVQIIGWV